MTDIRTRHPEKKPQKRTDGPSGIKKYGWTRTAFRNSVAISRPGCTASKLVLNARPGNAQKGASPSLGGGVHYFSRVVFGCQYVEESNPWIKKPILGYIGGGVVLFLGWC